MNPTLILFNLALLLIVEVNAGLAPDGVTIGFPQNEPVPVKSTKRSETVDQEAQVVGGSDVYKDDQYLYTYIVRLVQQSRKDSSRWTTCGGSLISDEWVLTAAHCVADSGLVNLYFGLIDENDIDTPSIVKRTSIGPDHIISHSDWDPTTFKNDIALIRLTPKITFTNEISPIRLPNPEERCGDYFGRLVKISGWGLYSDYYFDDKNLKTVDVNIVRDKARCAETWGDFVQYESMLCVDAYGTRGACSGDSGGPMVYTQENGLNLLVGLTSFGTTRGCETDDARVFTCVNGFRDWIVDTTGDTSLGN